MPVRSLIALTMTTGRRLRVHGYRSGPAGGVMLEPHLKAINTEKLWIASPRTHSIPPPTPPATT